MLSIFSFSTNELLWDKNDGNDNAALVALVLFVPLELPPFLSGSNRFGGVCDGEYVDMDGVGVEGVGDDDDCCCCCCCCFVLEAAVDVFVPVIG